MNVSMAKLALAAAMLLGGVFGCNGTEPVPTPLSASHTPLSTNAWHTLRVREDGTVWAWGFNAYGQLGDGTTLPRSSPVQVSGLSGVVAVSAGGAHSVAVRNDGTVWAWGNNTEGQLGEEPYSTRPHPTLSP